MNFVWLTKICSKIILDVFSPQILFGKLRIYIYDALWGRIKKFRDCCYGNGDNVRRLMSLDKDGYWTLTHIPFPFIFPAYSRALEGKCVECGFVPRSSINDHGLCSIPQLWQLPCSLDLPLEIFFSLKTKSHLKGARFEDTEEPKTMRRVSCSLSRKKEFQKCFNQWNRRWIKCVASKGDYINYIYLFALYFHLY